MDEVHRAAHALDHLARDHPVGEVAGSQTCMAPRTAVSMWPPRIMPKRRGGVEERGARRTVTVSLPALIRSASTSIVGGIRAHAEDAVLRVQHQLHPVGQVVRDQRRQPDAEIHVLAVGQLSAAARAPPSASRVQLMPTPPPRTVRLSIRLSRPAPG